MTTEYFYEHLFWLFIVILLYYVVLECSLLVTGFLSLKIINRFVIAKDDGLINTGNFKKIFAFSTISYFISIVCIYIYFSVLNGEIDIATFFLVIFRVATKSIAEPQLSVVFIISVLTGFFVNAIFNFFAIFKAINLTKRKRVISSLIVSFMTAPYLIFVGFEGLLNDIYYLL